MSGHVHSVHGHAVDFTGADEAVGFVGCHAEHALNGEVVMVALRYRDELACAAAAAA